MQQKLRDEAKALLEQKKVDYIIGYAPGSLKFVTTPLITRDVREVEKLVVNPFIANNLSVFLTRAKADIKGKVGIVAKGCDSRSIVSLIQDNQVKREDLVILGVPCSELLDITKIEKLVNRDSDEIDDIVREGDKVVVTVEGQKKAFALNEALADDCLACETPTPKEYDILLGEPVQTVCNKELSRQKIKQVEDMPLDARWEYWKKEFSRCIRCYACRQVCPACFCERCFVEETEPMWVSPAPRWQDNIMFQMVRIIHDAGRCADCGECERVCPVNIPLRSLAKKMDEVVYELFGYEVGADKTAKPFLTAYQQEEAEDLIR